MVRVGLAEGHNYTFITYCQAQPNPSSSWAELALFSLSPAYGLHNIAYGLHNIAYGLHNIAYGLHNIGKVSERVSKLSSSWQLQLQLNLNILGAK